MANEKEEVLQANAGASAADIPDLKKKDKERKRAGAAWSGLRGAGGDFSGATGGTVARAAASAAGMAAEEAVIVAEGVEGGGLWATLARLWAGLTSTLLGKTAAAAAAFLMVAAAALFGYSLMKGGGGGAVGAPDLGGITDSMRVRAGGGDRLGVSSKGELRFDPPSAAKPAPPPVQAKEPAAKPAPDVQADMDVRKPAPELAHNMSGAQLTSSLGGDFGSKNIFGSNSSAPKFNSAAAKLGGTAPAGLAKIGGFKGKLSSMPSTLHASASPSALLKGSANKAFGQLRIAKGMSQQGAASSTSEGASASAQGAFDQQAPVGGGLATSGAPGGDAVPSLGDDSAPDVNANDCEGGSCTPSSPAGMNATDPGLQDAINQIEALAQTAMSDIKTGIMEMMIGAILIAIGMATMPFGAALIAAGVALIAMGVMEIAAGMAAAAEAKALGQQLAQQIDNMQQGAVVNYCTDQAIAGVPPADCQPPDSVTNATNQTQQDATDVNQVDQIPVGTANIQ